MMDIDLQTFVPVAAVIIGWILAQLSGGFSVARENKRLRASSLPPMLDLYFQQYRINEILIYFNGRLTSSIDQLHDIYVQKEVPKEKRIELANLLLGNFEKTRQGNLDLPEKNKDQIIRAVEGAIESLSKVDPVGAYKLSRLLAEFFLLIEVKFPSEEVNSEKYLNTWGRLLESFRSDIHSLKALIYRVALGKGILTFIRIWYLIRQEEAGLSAPSDEILEELTETLKPNQSRKADA